MKHVDGINIRTVAKVVRGLSREKRELLAASVLEIRRRRCDPLKDYRQKYGKDPVAWITDFLEVPLNRYQMKPFEAIRDGFRRIAFYGPHGIGKSALAAVLVFWAVSTAADTKVITTASVWRQLDEYLWPEIHKWHARINWPKAGCAPEMLSMKVKFGVSAVAFPVASDNPTTIEGAHAERVVYLFDEAKIINPRTWESAEGALSTPGDHIQIALSTPGETSGTFYDICSRKEGYENWKVIHVSVRDAIRCGRMTLQWAREKHKQWGPNSTVYQQRVLGLFARDSDDVVIPLSWVEAAITRWHVWKREGCKRTGPAVIGADIAGMGVDKTVFAHVYDKVCSHLDRYEKQDPMTNAGKLRQAMGSDGRANVDVIGEGAGVVARLRENNALRRRVVAVNAAEKCERKDRSGLLSFANTRSAMWWNMRELLDPSNNENLCLPDDPLLIGDLTAPHKRERSDGAILIESKEDIKKRLRRSTDSGDAVVMGYWKNAQRTDYVVVANA